MPLLLRSDLKAVGILVESVSDKLQVAVHLRNVLILSGKGISGLPEQMSENFSPQRILVLNHILHLLEFILCPKDIAHLNFHSVSLSCYLSKSQKYSDAEQMMKMLEVQDPLEVFALSTWDVWEGR